MAVSVPHLSCQHDSASAATLHRAISTKRHPHLVMGNRGLGPSAGGLSGWPAAGLAHRRQHRPNNRSRCTTTACSDATNTVHTAKPMGTKYSSPVAWRGVSGVRQLRELAMSAQDRSSDGHCRFSDSRVPRKISPTLAVLMTRGTTCVTNVTCTQAPSRLVRRRAAPTTQHPRMVPARRMDCAHPDRRTQRTR